MMDNLQNGVSPAMAALLARTQAGNEFANKPALTLVAPIVANIEVVSRVGDDPYNPFGIINVDMYNPQPDETWYKKGSKGGRHASVAL